MVALSMVAIAFWLLLGAFLGVVFLLFMFWRFWK